MSLRIKPLSTYLLAATLLAGCGGSDEFSVGNGSGDLSESGTTTTDTDTDSSNTSTVTYLPLSVYERFESYSKFADGDGKFQPDGSDPLIAKYLINPVDAVSLASVSGAVATDYKVTIDEVDIDPSESFPYLQKVLGADASLNTALVFDLSGSISGSDLDALLTEAKAYINAAKANSNQLIAEQQFVVWAFAQAVEELTSGFTGDIAAIEAAIDTVKVRYDAGTLGVSSNLHRAVVQATGRFADEEGNDFSGDGDNDLYDSAKSNGTELSQMVIFSSGPDTLLEFDQASMVGAIQSQGFLKYEGGESSSTDDSDGIDLDSGSEETGIVGTTFVNKPVFYYVLGGDVRGNAYAALSAEAEKTTYLTLDEAAYSFSDELIANQLEAVSARIDLSNQYLYRFAYLPRIGDHDAVFASKTTANNYSFTAQYTEEYMLAYAIAYKGLATAVATDIGTPSQELTSLVEITGPNGEYLAIDADAGVPVISLSVASTFGPATRWVADEYVATDYAWAITGGAATGVANADGTYTISNITSSPVTLQLTNTHVDRGDTTTIRVVE